MHTIMNLQDLLVHHLQHLYYAEEQIASAMPVIIEKANHKSLKNALTHHLSLSAAQKKRLEKAIELINEHEVTKEKDSYQLISVGISKGIGGLIDETKDVLNQKLVIEVIDAAIISCIQKIEHYEICTYGTAIAYAKQLNLNKVEQVLQETLNEEYDADDLLTALATSAYNKEATPDDYQDEEKDEIIENDTAGSAREHKVSITERTINSPGGRAGTSHRGYSSGESRGH